VVSGTSLLCVSTTTDRRVRLTYAMTPGYATGNYKINSNKPASTVDDGQYNRHNSL